MSVGVEILNERKYFDICMNISKSGSLHKDLYQETVATILGKDYNLYEINERNELPKFFLCFAWKVYHSKQFRKLYGLDKQKAPFIEEILASDPQEYDHTADVKFDAIVYEIKREKETPREVYLDLLFKRYLECGESGQSVSSTYKIKPRTVFAGIREQKEKFKLIYEAAGKGR